MNDFLKGIESQGDLLRYAKGNFRILGKLNQHEVVQKSPEDRDIQTISKVFVEISDYLSKTVHPSHEETPFLKAMWNVHKKIEEALKLGVIKEEDLPKDMQLQQRIETLYETEVNKRDYSPVSDRREIIFLKKLGTYVENPALRAFVSKMAKEHQGPLRNELLRILESYSEPEQQEILKALREGFKESVPSPRSMMTDPDEMLKLLKKENIPEPSLPDYLKDVTEEEIFRFIKEPIILKNVASNFSTVFSGLTQQAGVISSKMMHSFIEDIKRGRMPAGFRGRGHLQANWDQQLLSDLLTFYKNFRLQRMKCTQETQKVFEPLATYVLQEINHVCLKIAKQQNLEGLRVRIDDIKQKTDPYEKYQEVSKEIDNMPTRRTYIETTRSRIKEILSENEQKDLLPIFDGALLKLKELSEEAKCLQEGVLDTCKETLPYFLKYMRFQEDPLFKALLQQFEKFTPETSSDLKKALKQFIGSNEKTLHEKISVIRSIVQDNSNRLEFFEKYLQIPEILQSSIKEVLSAYIRNFFQKSEDLTKEGEPFKTIDAVEQFVKGVAQEKRTSEEMVLLMKKCRKFVIEGLPVARDLFSLEDIRRLQQKMYAIITEEFMSIVNQELEELSQKGNELAEKPYALCDFLQKGDREKEILFEEVQKAMFLATTSKGTNELLKNYFSERRRLLQKAKEKIATMKTSKPIYEKLALFHRDSMFLSLLQKLEDGVEISHDEIQAFYLSHRDQDILLLSTFLEASQDSSLEEPFKKRIGTVYQELCKQTLLFNFKSDISQKEEDDKAFHEQMKQSKDLPFVVDTILLNRLSSIKTMTELRALRQNVEHFKFVVSLPAFQGMAFWQNLSKVNDRLSSVEKYQEQEEKGIGVQSLVRKFPVSEIQNVKTLIANQNEAELHRILDSRSTLIDELRKRYIIEQPDGKAKEIAKKKVAEIEKECRTILSKCKGKFQGSFDFYLLQVDYKLRLSARDVSISSSDEKTIRNAFIEAAKLPTPEMNDETDEGFLQRIDLKTNDVVYFRADLHGDLETLLNRLELLKKKGKLDENYCCKENVHLVFLGDYADRGDYGAHVLHLLARLRTGNKDNVHLIRGNHESRNILSQYGDPRLKAFAAKEENWEALQGFIRTMPLSLHLRKKDPKTGVGQYFRFVHGGIEIADDPKEMLDSPDPQATMVVKKKKSLSDRISKMSIKDVVAEENQARVEELRKKRNDLLKTFREQSSKVPEYELIQKLERIHRELEAFKFVGDEKVIRQRVAAEKIQHLFAWIEVETFFSKEMEKVSNYLWSDLGKDLEFGRRGNAAITLTPEYVQAFQVLTSEDELLVRGHQHFYQTHKALPVWSKNEADAVPKLCAITLPVSREIQQEGKKGTWMKPEHVDYDYILDLKPMIKDSTLQEIKTDQHETIMAEPRAVSDF